MYVYVPLDPWCPGQLEDGVESPGTRITDGWELNLDPLGENF